MKILSLCILFIFCVVNLNFGQINIQNELDKFINDPNLTHASISVNVIDLETNISISSKNPELRLATASTAKLFSSATALEILGDDFRAKTRMYYDGEIDSNGILHGNIWIRGGGDPSFGSKYFPKEKPIFEDWVNAIHEIGIKKINGAVIGDASEFDYNGAPDGWSWSDLGNYYGAGASGLTIHDNLIELHFKTSSKVGETSIITKIEPEVEGLEIKNYVLSSQKRGDNSYIYGAPYSMDRFVTGTLPISNSDFIVKGSLPDPELQFSQELLTAINEKSIEVTKGHKSLRTINKNDYKNDYSKMSLIHTHKGERLIDILRITNHKSINLYAEHMLYLISHQKLNYGSIEGGLKLIHQKWSKEKGFQGLKVKDGSGLSRTNAISAENYTKLLYWMNKSKNADFFFSTLPIAGESGTLKSLCKGQSGQGRIFAKSGTMSGIKSYSGYVHSSSGKKFAFAIIVNNHLGSTSALKRKMGLFLNKIALL
ncbi:MAG: D-alanyl-D-alanine carboxypeptidase/D-alanyl-D-alanine-endopeptidase [Flavobacteriales bacterium]|nr:D-alanyl-D-alanine carboxypeptidase/D-alanyl-D-alanine-endopeptidase [Flavobacteriales bacterium]